MSTPVDNRSRDPRQRDRSRSELRRPESADRPVSTPSTSHTPSVSNNSVADFFRTLGLSSQLIQALINANPPRVEQAPAPLPSSPPVVHNAHDFASFLSQSYGLHTTTHSSVNRGTSSASRSFCIYCLLPIDPRRRHLSTAPGSLPPRADPCAEPHSLSVDESFKQYLCSINQSAMDEPTRKRLQRIALLDSELDKLHRMNIELTKSTERRSRRHRCSTARDKDPLLKENETLQAELIEHIRTLKSTTMMTYPVQVFAHPAVARCS